MLIFWNALLLLLFFLPEGQTGDCEDQCALTIDTTPQEQCELTNCAKYKMITMWGAPVLVSSYPTKFTANADWDKCVTDCLNEDCTMVYRNSSNFCVVYNIGDVMKIRKDFEASNAMDKVSFKVETTETGSCYLKGSDGKISPVNTRGVWGSGLSYKFIETGATIGFTYSSDNIKTCNYWLDTVLQCSDCTKTMFSFRGTILNSNTESVYVLARTSQWFQCLNACYEDKNCFMVEKIGSWCKGYSNGDPYVVVVENENADIKQGDYDTTKGYLGMKYVPTEVTCSLSFNQMISGTYSFVVEDTTVYNGFDWTGDGKKVQFSWKGRTYK